MIILFNMMLESAACPRADRGFRHAQLPHRPGAVPFVYDGDGGNGLGRGHGALRAAGGGVWADRQGRQPVRRPRGPAADDLPPQTPVDPPVKSTGETISFSAGRKNSGNLSRNVI